MHLRILQTSAISARPSTGARGAKSSRGRKEGLLMRSSQPSPWGFGRSGGGSVLRSCLGKPRRMIKFQPTADWTVSTPEDSDDVRPSPNRRPGVSRMQKTFPSGVWSPRFRSRPHSPPLIWQPAIYLFSPPAAMSPCPEVPRYPWAGLSIPQQPRSFLVPSSSLGGYVHIISSRILYIESFPRK